MISMKATKGNKTYTITEQEKKRYTDAGYDIQSDSGEIIAYGRGKTVPVEKYEEMESRCKELEKQLEACRNSTGTGQDSGSRDINKMSAEELMAYAAEQQIDIGKSTSRDGILEKIKVASKQGS